MNKNHSLEAKQTQANQQLDLCTSYYLSEEEQQTIQDLSQVKKYKKGTLLLREGEFPSTCYLVIKGLVRQYYLVDGEEKTTFFYAENESISSSTNAERRVVSKFFLECVEDCEFSQMDYDKEIEMYRRIPRIEKLCRINLEEKLAYYQDMFATFMVSSPEDRYRNLLNTRPDLLSRVPQYQLASYLGVKPESLSRIRKRIAEQGT